MAYVFLSGFVLAGVLALSGVAGPVVPRLEPLRTPEKLGLGSSEIVLTVAATAWIRLCFEFM